MTPQELQSLQDYWDDSGISAMLSPMAIHSLIANIHTMQNTPVSAFKSNATQRYQGSPTAMTFKPATEVQCEFDRVEGSQRPFTGMAFRVCVRIPLRADIKVKVEDLAAWCHNQWGVQNRYTWRHVDNRFYFKDRRHAMLFKMRWHGVQD